MFLNLCAQFSEKNIWSIKNTNELQNYEYFSSKYKVCSSKYKNVPQDIFSSFKIQGYALSENYSAQIAQYNFLRQIFFFNVQI